MGICCSNHNRKNKTQKLINQKPVSQLHNMGELITEERNTEKTPTYDQQIEQNISKINDINSQLLQQYEKMRKEFKMIQESFLSSI